MPLPQKQTVAKTTATAVVSNSAADGDFTDLQTAITALGTAGGTIYIRKGTLSLPMSTISFPAGGHFRLVGAGKKTAILDFPSGGASLLSPGVAGQMITLENLRLKGNSGANQRVHENAFAGACLTFIDVEIDGFKTITNVAADTDVHFIRCKITMPAIVGWSVWIGPNDLGKLTWTYVDFVKTLNEINGAAGRPDWTVTNSYIGGGPPDKTEFVMGKVMIQGLRCDFFRVAINGAKSFVSNFDGIDSEIFLFSADETNIVNCNFVQITDEVFEGLNVRDTENVNISNCHFDGGVGLTNPTAIHIDENAAGPTLPPQRVTIANCTFENWDSEAIHLAECDNVLITNCFFAASNSKSIRESGGISDPKRNWIVNCQGVYVGTGPTLLLGSASESKIDKNSRTITTTPVTLDEFHDVARMDATAANATVNLPPAANALGKFYYIKKIDVSANTVTVDADGAELIDGALTVVLTAQYQSRTFFGNGVGWDIL